MRTNFPAKVKALAMQRCGGCCEDCGLKILGRPEYDHVLPDALAGEATLENCQVLCAKCHRRKTTADQHQIAKADRIRRNAEGRKVMKGRPLRGTRASGLRKRMNGTVEPW